MISVIMSTFNRADTFLPKSIESVRKQSLKDWELIIVDDCSFDNTQEVVESYQDQRIKYIKLNENFGSDTHPKNVGASASTGEYLLFLDDDVVLRPNALKTLKKELDSNPQLDVVYGDMWITPNNEAGIAHDYDRQFLMLRNYIDTSSAMMRRSAIFDVGGWDETLKKFVDWNLWVRMTKAGKNFKRVSEFTFDYTLHSDAKSQRIETPMYEHPELGTLFEPTFDPAGCYIKLPYLGEVKEPRVAIFTIHYDRLAYTQVTQKLMFETAGYPFDWYCVDNGTDGTFEWLDKMEVCKLLHKNPENKGITESSNYLIDVISKGKYDIIIKVDNDVEFQTNNWLADIVDLWKRNNMIYVSPYVEGLRDNPGGAMRIGYGMIGTEFIEVTNHIGGIFAAVSAKAYSNFRWSDEFLHGNQDLEASHAFRLENYMPCYYPKHRITHMEGTEGQQKRYKQYFDRRKGEKSAKL